MKRIEDTIAALNNRADLYETKVSDIRQCIRTLRKTFDIDVEVSEHPIPKAEKPQSRKQPGSTTRKTRRKKSRPGSAKPFSKYKGVTKAKSLKDGKPRFMASIWRDKNVTLGTFTIEEEAAAAAAEARGEKELAQELRNKIEQIENNPDRPGTKLQKHRGKSHAAHGHAQPTGQAALETYFECDVCHLEYTKRPKRCAKENCHSKSFSKKQR